MQNQEIGGHTMDKEHSLTTQQLTLLNQILDSFFLNGQAFITVTLESVVSSHEPQVKVRLRKTGGVMEIMTSELIPVQKSYFDHTNSVTSQRWWSEQRTL